MCACGNFRSHDVPAGTLITFSGFLIQRARITPVWRWAFWLSPFSYGLQALAINQFRGQDGTCLIISGFGAIGIYPFLICSSLRVERAPASDEFNLVRHLVVLSCVVSVWCECTTNSYSYNLAYPLGFQGNQACAINNGDEFLTAVGMYNGTGYMYATHIHTLFPHSLLFTHRLSRMNSYTQHTPNLCVGGLSMRAL